MKTSRWTSLPPLPWLAAQGYSRWPVWLAGLSLLLLLGYGLGVHPLMAEWLASHKQNQMLRTKKQHLQQQEQVFNSLAHYGGLNQQDCNTRQVRTQALQHDLTALVGPMEAAGASGIWLESAARLHLSGAFPDLNRFLAAQLQANPGMLIDQLRLTPNTQKTLRAIQR